ncbi:hypothetical protein GCM10027599_28580 [Yimella radicis]
MVVPRGVTSVGPESAVVLDSEDADEVSELVGDSEVVLDSEVDVEVCELEGDSEVLVDSELVEDDVLEELVTVVSLLQAVRPSAPTSASEVTATRLRMAVLDMLFLPVCRSGTACVTTPPAVRFPVVPNRF